MPALDKNLSSPVASTLKAEAQEAPVIKPQPLRTLLEWEAPTRVFKKRSREYFTTIGAMVFLLVVILLFLKEWLLIMAIVALMFVAYVFASVPPDKLIHKITSRGITTGGKDYPWGELKRFWLSEKWGQKILFVEAAGRVPRRLVLLLGETNQDELKKILSDYLLLEEPSPTWMDKAGDWLSLKIPLEK